MPYPQIHANRIDVPSHAGHTTPGGEACSADPVNGHLVREAAGDLPSQDTALADGRRRLVNGWVARNAFILQMSKSATTPTRVTH